MEHYAGLDVSLEQTSVCVVDARGEIVREAKVASEPEALIGFLRGRRLAIGRVGLEAGPLSQWLHPGLVNGSPHDELLKTLPLPACGSPSLHLQPAMALKVTTHQQSILDHPGADQQLQGSFTRVGERGTWRKSHARTALPF